MKLIQGGCLEEMDKKEAFDRIKGGYFTSIYRKSVLILINSSDHFIFYL